MDKSSVKPMALLSRRGLWYEDDCDEEFQDTISDSKTLALKNKVDMRLRPFDLECRLQNVTMSSKGLLPWEMAATWIDFDARPHWKITLRPISSSFYRLFSLSVDELLAHEYIHAVRYRLCSTQFEEILAYQTSTSSFRQTLGAYFPSSFYSVISLALWGSVSVLLLLSDIFSWSLGLAGLAFAGATTLNIFFASRLFFNLKKIKRVKHSLKKRLKPEVDPLAVLVRMSDAEIRAWSQEPFSKSKIKTNTLTSMRWRQIALYFN